MPCGARSSSGAALQSVEGQGSASHFTLPLYAGPAEGEGEDEIEK